MTEAEQNTTRKKWIIGCGGCLVITIVLSIALFLLGGMFIGNLKDTSDKAVKTIFGTDPPASYTVLGWPVNQGEFKELVLLVEPYRSIAIFAAESQPSQADFQDIRSMDARKVEAYIRRLISEAPKGKAAQAGPEIQGIDFEEVHPAKLANGKSVPVIGGRVFAQQKNSYSPAVVILVPKAGNRLVSLVAIDGKNRSTDKKENFAPQRKVLEAELLRIIQHTQLDEKLI